MISTRLFPCLLLLTTFACKDDGMGDDLPAGAFTSGPDDDGTFPGESSSGPGATSSPETTTGVEDTGSTGPIELSHDEHILPLWTESCVDASCHDPDEPQAGLDLVTDGVYGRLCRDFHGQSGMPYIDCNGLDPQNSYVFRKLENTHLMGITGASGGPMPPTGLPEDQIALVEAWIAGGALP